MTTFSILVPTVDRPETLVHCLRTLVDQPGKDFEIIVSDDQGQQANREVVESFGKPNLVRYIRTPRRLGMRGNYEYSVEHSRGEYVTILGDDDGLCVNALATAREVLMHGRPDVFFWFPHLYWWPNALVQHKRWMLYVYANPKTANWVNARNYVDNLFTNSANPWLFERLPSIYNGFVHRDLLARLKGRTGSYFCDEVPDVYSGIANAVMAKSAICVENALSVRGISGKSYGVSFRNKKEGASIQGDFKRHMATPMCEPEYIDSTALAVHIASIKLRATRRFAELSHFTLDVMDVIKGIFTELNEDDGRYDDLVADARLLAQKYQIDWNSVQVPPRFPGAKQSAWGVTTHLDGRAVIAVNGGPLGIADIHRASLCVYSMLG